MGLPYKSSLKAPSITACLFCALHVDLSAITVVHSVCISMVQVSEFMYDKHLIGLERTRFLLRGVEVFLNDMDSFWASSTCSYW